MEPTKTNAKNFFLNLGAIVALYAVVISLLNLLFTVINKAYPTVTGYNYYGSQNISWPVAMLIVVFPIFIVLMWLLGKGYMMEPEKKNVGVRKWLIYITLFVAGIVLAGDLISVLYYFLDGQELTTGFILKVLSVFIVTCGVFLYYISDIRGKLTQSSQKTWLIISVVVILLSIAWGFSVLGSPRTQRLIKYDTQKVTDLQNVSYQVEDYYRTNNKLPDTLTNFAVPLDQQSGQAYQYEKIGNNKYNLCAEFNSVSGDATQPNVYMRPIGYQSWEHPAGHYCFEQTINPAQYPKPASY